MSSMDFRLVDELFVCGETLKFFSNTYIFILVVSHIYCACIDQRFTSTVRINKNLDKTKGGKLRRARVIAHCPSWEIEVYLRTGTVCPRPIKGKAFSPKKFPKDRFILIAESRPAWNAEARPAFITLRGIQITRKREESFFFEQDNYVALHRHPFFLPFSLDVREITNESSSVSAILQTVLTAFHFQRATSHDAVLSFVALLSRLGTRYPGRNVLLSSLSLSFSLFLSFSRRDNSSLKRTCDLIESVERTKVLGHFYF